MKLHPGVAVAVSLWLTLSPAAWAQEPTAALRAGDRIRYRPPGSGGLSTGRVVDIQEGWLLVQPGPNREPVRVAVSSLARLEVHRGRRSLAKEGAILGFLPGAIYGGLFGAYGACDDQGSGCNPLGGALLGALMVGGVTSGAGALIGLPFKTDRWEKLPVRNVRVAVIPTRGGVGASVSVGF
jgi:hypothetical protein